MSRPYSRGHKFPEGPRWHDGRIWFADQHDHKVYAGLPDAAPEVIVEIDDMPSGLGFLPDGTLLISAMRSGRILAYRDGETWVHADLSSIGGGWANDMLVDAAGRAYVGYTLGPLFGSEHPTSGQLVLVEPDGDFHAVAGDMSFANGPVLTPDGDRLLVAESGAHRVTSFDVAPDGSLSDRGVFADLGEHSADGICLDAEGAVWVASPYTDVFLRVQEGGQVLDTVPAQGGWPLACVLGGADRRMLYMLTAQVPAGVLAALRESNDAALDQQISDCVGRVDVIAVKVPGAGTP